MRIATVVIEIINTCNLRCKHCYGLFETQVIMPLNKYQSYLKELYDCGATRLTITGGEPFLMGNKLIDYILIARKIGFPYIAITTNGTIQIDNIQQVIDSINLLQISLDGEESVHDDIRGKGTYRKTTQFIQQLSVASRDKVCIMMSLHKKNFSNLEVVHKYARLNKVSFAVEIVTQCGRGSNLEILDSAQMQSVNKYVVQNSISCNDPITFCNRNDISFFNFQLLAGCAAGISALCVDSKGVVYPCARLRIPMGNLSEGVDTIFKSELYKNLNNRKLLKGKCARCKFLYSCGGCRARAFAVTGDYLAEDRHCITYIEN